MAVAPLELPTVTGLFRLGLADLSDGSAGDLATAFDVSDVSPRRSKARSNGSKKRSGRCDESPALTRSIESC